MLRSAQHKPLVIGRLIHHDERASERAIVSFELREVRLHVDVVAATVQHLNGFIFGPRNVCA